MLAKSTSARCNVYGRVSREISATYKLLGSLHLSLGDTDKCLSVLKKVTTTIVDSGSAMIIDSGSATIVDSETAMIVDSKSATIIDSDSTMIVDSESTTIVDSETATIPKECAYIDCGLSENTL